MTTEVGHNQPPSMIDTAGEVTTSLNDWMKDHPVVETEEMAREAKLLIDRAKLCVKDLEDERTGKVKPLNLQVDEINASYRPPRGILQKVQEELTRRVTDYLCKVEAIKIKEAEEARQRADKAEREAREAEHREREAADDARHGAEVDVALTVKAADEAFADFKRADREAARAEREAKVRIGGGFTRSLSLRNKETLSVVHACDAITAIGITPDIEAAIIKGARAFRTMHGKLPSGVESKTERSA